MATPTDVSQLPNTLSRALSSQTDGSGRDPPGCRTVWGVPKAVVVLCTITLCVAMWLPRVQSAVYGRGSPALVSCPGVGPFGPFRRPEPQVE